jgi:sugar/nucleoside kinase (ribokinase family)
MKKAVCVGTGLVALDIILNGNPKTPPKFYTGGSCGNVLSILSYLGWASYPIARLDNDKATTKILSDLKRWDVKRDLISVTDDGSTPIIIHRILKDKAGNPKHRFEFKDPETKEWLPSYKPVLSKKVIDIAQKLSFTPNVFYFDRVNRASINLAKLYNSEGALVFFEPSSMGDNKLFMEAASASHIIKFSSDRISNYRKLFKKSIATLEIETLGAKGLKFRYSKNKNSESWHAIDPIKVDNLIDFAGAGDWCSAMVINLLGKAGKFGFQKKNISDIISALYQAQHLSVLNCFFDGARGIMYNLEINRVKSFLTILKSSKKVDFGQFLSSKKIRKPDRESLK